MTYPWCISFLGNNSVCRSACLSWQHESTMGAATEMCGILHVHHQSNAGISCCKITYPMMHFFPRWPSCLQICMLILTTWKPHGSCYRNVWNTTRLSSKQCWNLSGCHWTNSNLSKERTSSSAGESLQNEHLTFSTTPFWHMSIIVSVSHQLSKSLSRGNIIWKTVNYCKTLYTKNYTQRIVYG